MIEVHANHAIIFGFQHIRCQIGTVELYYFIDIGCFEQCFKVL